MEIHIHSDKKLKDIQDEFAVRFPYLKLEFYEHTHDVGEGNANSAKLNIDIPISNAGKKVSGFDWQITGLTTVAELEQAFQEQLGIGVQVFRRSGKIWLQTTNTDYQTLGEQNVHGGESTKAIPREEPGDYREQE
jgi:hypothetical protein